MRNELEIIEKIEQYLSGQLSPADKAAFEAQLATDASLREALRHQQDILAAIDRIAVQQAIHRARQRFYRTHYLTRWGGLGLGVIIIATLIALFLRHHSHNRQFNAQQLTTTTYTIDPTRDTVLHTVHGATLTISRGAITAKGATTVQLWIKEAYTPADIVNGGLETRSNGALLGSGGMIDIESANNHSILFNKPIRITIPASRLQEGMQLYKGETTSDGTINWTDPKPLADTTALADLRIGQAIFQSNCAQCHSFSNPVTGPALAYIGQRRDHKWLAAWIHNNQQVLASGDPYANYIFCRYNKTPMNTFPNLTDNEINQVLLYLDNNAPLHPPASVPDEKRSFDNCVAAGRIGHKDTIYIDPTRPTIETASTHLHTGSSPTQPAPYTYTFYINGPGWYNIDHLMHNCPNTRSCSIRVHIGQQYADDINVYLVIPGEKVLATGSPLDNHPGEFDFNYDGDSIYLPMGEPATIITNGAYKGQQIFGMQSFTTTPEIRLNVQLSLTTPAQVHAAIDRLGLQDLRDSIPLSMDTTYTSDTSHSSNSCSCALTVTQGRVILYQYNGAKAAPETDSLSTGFISIRLANPADDTTARNKPQHP
jgi:mono/diheme cytochrome c family protein